MSVGSSNIGLASVCTHPEAGLLARLFYRVAVALIDTQCQSGRRAYPSRLFLKFLQYSADQGHVLAMARLGGMLYRCGVSRVDKRSGLEYLRQAAKRGDVQSRFLLGSAYLDGQLVRRDDKTALHWLALAADAGHAEAARLLQTCKALDTNTAIPVPDPLPA